MSVVRTPLGHVVIAPKGNWDSSTTYNVLDLVYYDNKAYLAKQDIPLNTSITSDTYWMMMVEGGVGPTGPQGPEGQIGPTGIAAGFTTPIASITTLSSGEAATVTITASGDNTAKLFSFNFGIPQGPTGPQGIQGEIGPTGPEITGPTGPTGPMGAGGYGAVTFTSTDGSGYYWNDNNIIFERTDLLRLPLYIYNNNNQSIAATFIISDSTGDPANKIIYEADSRFDGTLYYITPDIKIERGTISVGTVSISTGVGVYNVGTSTDAIYNFDIPIGPTGAAAGFTTPIISVTTLSADAPATASISASGLNTEKLFEFDFGIPQGATGPTGPRGDTGAGGTWGNIEGDITTQTDLNTFLDNKVSKNGDTLTGQLINSKVGGQWVKGRDNAALKIQNGGSNWKPAVSMLGANGDWSIGRNANASEDSLCLSYSLNDYYTSSTNQVYKIMLPVGANNTTTYLFAGKAQTTDPGVGSSLSTNTILLVYEA